MPLKQPSTVEAVDERADLAPSLLEVSEVVGLETGEVRTGAFRHTFCSARLQTVQRILRPGGDLRRSETRAHGEFEVPGAEGNGSRRRPVDRSDLRARAEAAVSGGCGLVSGSAGYGGARRAVERTRTVESRLAVEMAIVKARIFSRYYPTLLILNSGMGSIDERGWLHYMEALSSLRSFQSVVVSALWNHKLDWGGWEVARFEGRPPRVRILQT